MKVKLEIKEDKVIIAAPYDREFTSAMHNLNGKWDSIKKTWTVDIDVLDEVREILSDIYGANDLTNDLVDVWVTIPENELIEELQAPVKLFGKVVATAWGRDSGAKWGPDIVNKNASCSSGGSMRNWKTFVRTGSFKIKSVSKARIEADRELYEKKGFSFEFVGKKLDTAALEEEKKRLLDRIAEIDRLLGESATGKLPNNSIAHWIERPNESGENWEYSMYECSNCHEWSDNDSNYCPNCGKEMK